jgi:hypothetical protein
LKESAAGGRQGHCDPITSGRRLQHYAVGGLTGESTSYAEGCTGEAVAGKVKKCARISLARAPPV